MNSVTGIGAGAPSQSFEKAKETAKQFEAVFLSQMTQLMIGTTPSEGPFSGGHGEEMFRGMMAEQMGSAIAERGGVGLAPRVLEEIIRLQGGMGHGA